MNGSKGGLSPALHELVAIVTAHSTRDLNISAAEWKYLEEQ
jgi:hypothetical protein